MKAGSRALAAAHLLLIFPAMLFMGALLARHLPPLQSQPAHSAQQIVMWYAARMWTLWVLLLALPVSVMITGGLSLMHRWTVVRPAHQGIGGISTDSFTLCTLATTVAAAIILAIVILHMLAN